MLVAEPESLKSEVLRILEGRMGVMVKDDITTHTIKGVRAKIAGGAVSTLVLPELQKLFERRESTSANTLGHLRAFVHDGIYEGPEDDGFQDAATCTVLGGVTPHCYHRNSAEWHHNGFMRRVLWCHYKLMDGKKQPLRQAMKLDISLPIADPVLEEVDEDIEIEPMSTLKEREMLTREFNSYLPVSQHKDRLEMMRLVYKIYDVLKWARSEGMVDENPMDIVKDFLPSLGAVRGIVELELPESFNAILEKAKAERLKREEEADSELIETITLTKNGGGKTTIRRKHETRSTAVDDAGRKPASI